MTDTATPAKTPGSSEDTGLDTWHTFLQAHATVMRQLESDLEADGELSLADFDVLVQLARASEHRLRMSDLAEVVVLSRSGMTRRIDRLEAAGLVRRFECSADRRGAFAALTEAGHRRMQEMQPRHLRGVQEHFLSHLTPEDRECVRAALGKVLGRDTEDTPPAAC